MVPSGRVLRPDRVRLALDFDSRGVPLTASVSTYAHGDLLGCTVWAPEPFDTYDDLLNQVHVALAKLGAQMTLF